MMNFLARLKFVLLEVSRPARPYLFSLAQSALAEFTLLTIQPVGVLFEMSHSGSRAHLRPLKPPRQIFRNSSSLGQPSGTDLGMHVLLIRLSECRIFCCQDMGQDDCIQKNLSSGLIQLPLTTLGTRLGPHEKVVLPPGTVLNDDLNMFSLLRHLEPN